MARAARKQPDGVRLCAGLLSRLAYRRAKRQGVEVAPLAEKAGLTVAAIEDPAARLSVTGQIDFAERVADALNDRLLGFHVAQDVDFREIGLLYYVAASADTAGTALSRVERYSHVQNEAVRIKVSAGKSVRVAFQYIGVSRHTDIHQIVGFATLVIRILRHLTARPLSPTTVWLMHRLGSDKAAVERLLNCTVHDGAKWDAVEFPASSWDLPIVSADPHLHQLCIENCEAVLARRQRSDSPLKVKVENAIAASLPHGQARQDLVAAKLDMSPRTLVRRLSSEGTSFAEILNGVRSALSRRYLADRTLSISEIAWLLGYAEIGAFSRAFQRWSGTSPSVARARQL